MLFFLINIFYSWFIFRWRWLAFFRWTAFSGWFELVISSNFCFSLSSPVNTSISAQFNEDAYEYFKGKGKTYDMEVIESKCKIIQFLNCYSWVPNSFPSDLIWNKIFLKWGTTNTVKMCVLELEFFKRLPIFTCSKFTNLQQNNVLINASGHIWPESGT